MNENQQNKNSLRVAFYATVPFQLRVLEPLASGFENQFISFNPSDIKLWKPDVIVVTAEHELPLFRDYCDETKCLLIGLRHGAGFKYVTPPKEYLMADFICGSEWDKKDFERANIKPRKEFLLTGNAWVDKVFQVEKKKLNKTNPTFLFAPTWNPDTSASGFFHLKLVSLIRQVFPESKIIIKPHPNTLTYEHPYLIKFADIYKKWIDGWRQEAKSEEVVFVSDPKTSLPDFYGESDVMISDASTAIFEFMALNKPILLYTSPLKPDIENYDDNALGNCMRDIGKEFSDDEEFTKSLRTLFVDHTHLYSNKQTKYSNDIFGKYQDGKSYLRVIDTIKSLKEKIVLNGKNNLQVTKGMGDGKKLMSIDTNSEFAGAIIELFTKIKPQKIIETGTYLGQGTTSIIANTLKELNLNDAEFHSIEVNSTFYLRAFENLLENDLLKFVKLHHGLSVPRTMLPSIQQIKSSTVENLEFKDIFIDHDESERALKYFEETNFDVLEDDLLEKCLAGFNYSPDFVLLDSAGHMGNIEFNYLLTKINRECYIGLDDVYHIKHHKSLLQIQSDPRFEIIKLSREKFGFCIAKFSPKEIPVIQNKTALVRNRFNVGILPEHTVVIGLIEHMGDIVACEPVSRFVRDKYPGSYIVWVVSERYRELIDTNPYIDETYTVSCLTEWIMFKNSKLFNEVIDLHIQDRVCPTCNIPLPKKTGRVDITLDNYYNHGNLLSAFTQNAGLPILEDKPNVYISEAIKQSVDELKLPEKFIVFHTLSNEYTRDWKDDKWISLANAIQQKYGLRIVEVGHRSVLSKDKNLIYTNLCGRTSILQTAEVIRRASIFIGIDSAAAHLANAVGTYGIILLGEYRAFKKYVPYSGDYGKGINSELVYSSEGPASEIPVVQVLFAIGKALKKTEDYNPEKELPRACDPSARLNYFGKLIQSAPVRMLAIYLPQFHPIPENDSWWGKGFTEWTNVAKAKPLFPGHYQPHLPSDLGFYDLRLSDSRVAQAELAAKFGIEGFCYYHYWFNGKRLIERPFNEVLESGKPDFPFCLAWANENWTKRWDGREAEMLQEQVYGGKDDVINHFKYLLKAFTDKRYIRINNKPVFMIYRPSGITGLQELIKTWRKLALHAGLDGIYLIAFKTGFEAFPKGYWNDHGFDNELIFQPGTGKINLLNKWQPLSELGAGEHISTEAIVVDYEKAWKLMINESDERDNNFSCVVPSWDNSPRRAKIGAYVLHNSNPDSYKKWLDHEIHRVLHRNDDERLVFLNAWNEWAEGNHLEPDHKFGSGYLKATKDAMDNSLIDLARLALLEGNRFAAEMFAKKALLTAIRNNAERFHSEATLVKEKKVDYDAEVTIQDIKLSEVCQVLGMIKYSNRQFPEAIQFFEQSLTYQKSNVLSALLMADIFSQNNQEAVSRNIYQELISNTNTIDLALTLGDLLTLAALEEEANFFYSLSLQYKQSDNIKTSLSDYDIEILRTGFINNFGSSVKIAIEVYFALQELPEAQEKLNTGNYEEACTQFTKLLNVLPSNIPILVGLALTYSKQNKLSASLEILKEALKLQPDNIHLLRIMAGIYLENGMTRESLTIYKQLIAKFPKDTDLLMEIAAIQLKFENYEEAQSILKNILALEPMNYEARNLLFEIEMSSQTEKVNQLAVST